MNADSFRLHSSAQCPKLRCSSSRSARTTGAAPFCEPPARAPGRARSFFRTLASPSRLECEMLVGRARRKLDLTWKEVLHLIISSPVIVLSLSGLQC